MHSDCARTLLKFGGHLQTLGGHKDHALRIFNHAIENANPPPAGHLKASLLSNKGMILDEDGDIDGAESCYRRALDLDSFHVETLAGLGNLLLYKRRNAIDARTMYERAVAAKHSTTNSHAMAMRNLGVMLLQISDWGGAEKWCKKSLELEPGNLKGRMYLAGALMKTQQIENGAAEEVLASIGM